MAIFSENKLLNVIVDNLKDNDFSAHNKFGSELNLDRALQQANNIYVFQEGINYRTEASEVLAGTIIFQLWCIDQVVAVDQDKDDYTCDLLRIYLASGSWKYLGLDTDFPDNQIEPFMLESERTIILEETRNKVTIFRGSVNFKSQMGS